jgi:hypothetical protein
MGTTIPSGFVEIRKGVYERVDTIKKRAISKDKSANSSPKPQRPVQCQPMGEAKSKKDGAGRIHIRFTTRRKRLIDPDNIVAKYFIDCLRYAGAISDDTEKHISLETHQEKTREQEETIIELFHCEPT